MLEASRGKSDETQRLAQRLVRAIPDSADGFQVLAAAIFDHDGSLEAARAALELRWKAMPEVAFGPEGSRAAAEQADEYRLAILAGDWTAAESHLQRWTELTKSNGQARISGYPLHERVALLIETNRDHEAAELAHNVREKARAWAGDENYELQLDLSREELRTGGIDVPEFARRRDIWLSTRAGQSSLTRTPAGIWIVAYAGLPVALSAPPPSTDPFLLDWYSLNTEYLLRIGQSHFQSGQMQNAIAVLGLAGSNCFLNHPISKIASHYDLGLALEGAGDITSACDAHRFVMAHWDPTQSRHAKLASEHFAQLHCR